MIQAHTAAPRAPISRLLAAATVVSVLDGAFAVVLYVYVLRLCSAAQLMQSIAGALLGRAAFRGGAATVALGLGLHFAVAAGWTLVYAALRAASGRLRELTATTRGALIVGAVLGVFIWLAMDLLIVPLSRASATPVRSPMFAILLVWHALGVGIPLTLIVRDRTGAAPQLLRTPSQLNA
ncbi:MAG TPA: hypothetical protein VKB87_24855 [Myxococcaceae bacterium]|nr:hypothetical protein [Myxococcaceae bacterium]